VRSLVFFALILAGCTPTPDLDRTSGFDVASLMPPVSSLPGWTVAEEVTEYDPETLYEYLDGGAPAYVDFGFERVAHARYALGDDDFRSITLDLYDMGGKLGAFGIYSSIRPRDVVVRDWGTEGYRIGETAAAWKDRYYVHAVADDDSPDLTGPLEHLVARVIDAVPGDRSNPGLLERLPADDRIAHTERYVAKDLFGHAFLRGGLLARYDCGPEECTVFLSDLGSPAAADEALARLRSYEESFGSVLQEDPGIGADGFHAVDPGLGPGLVTRLERFVAGAWGGTPERRRSLLAGVSAVD
jgi:hypothetical protein